MKLHKFIFALATIATISLVCCNRNTEKAEPAETKTEQLQTGDLVFVALPLDYMSDTTEMGSAIAASTL